MDATDATPATSPARTTQRVRVRNAPRAERAEAASTFAESDEPSSVRCLSVPTLAAAAHAVHADPANPADGLPSAFLGFAERHPELTHTLALAALLARTDTPIVIEGPESFPREHLAACIHGASARANAPLVVVSCRTLAQTEADLALSRPGLAATLLVGALERAATGTIVLDEPGELDRRTQSLLLDVLRGLTSGDAARVLVTSTRALEQLVDEGMLLKDLFYELADARLDVFSREDMQLFASSAS